MKLKISAVLSVVCLFIVSSVSAAIPPAEGLLPSDTLMMFSIPDCDTLSASVQHSPQGLLWHDPSMKPFHDDFMTKWHSKLIAPMEQSLGIQVSDYLPLLRGQLTFAITQNGWDGTDGTRPAMLLLLDAKDKSDLLATNLAALKQKWKNSGKPVRAIELQGVKFSAVTFPTNSPLPFASALSPGANNTSSNTLYIGQFKSLLIAGTSIRSVEGVAAHLNGGANPDLLQNSQFAADQLSQFRNSPLYYAWFNARTFFYLLTQAQSGQDSGTFPMSTILQASGLMDLKSISFSYRETREGSQMEVFAAAPESARHGLLKMVTAAAKDASPGPFVPANVIQFFRWRVDGQKAWDELEKTLTTASPAMITYINSFIMMANASAQQQNPNFDLRKDLIGNLGDDWIKFSKAPTGNTLADLNSEPYLFLFAANNSDEAIFALKTLGGMLSSSTPKPQDFLGRKIYTIALPSGRAMSATGAPVAAPQRSLYCTASGGYIAVSSDLSMIQNYLRSNDGKTKPLSQTPGLTEAAQHVGGMGNGLFGYQNQSASARALLAALKNDPSAGAAAFNSLSGLPVNAPGGSLRDLANFSLLPDYEAISKYFYFTVYAGTSTANGLDFKYFQPRPPGLN